MLPNIVLLTLRLAVIPLIILSVIYFFRNRRAGDKRQLTACLAGAAVAVLGVAALMGQLISAPDAFARFKAASLLPAAVLAGVVIWLSCYAGMLLGEKQGGYWIKRDTRILSACSLGVIGAVGTLLFTVILSRSLAVPVTNHVPDSTVAWGNCLFRTLAYSFGEEVFYRGWAQAYLATVLSRFRGGAWFAIPLIALAFAVQHTGGLYHMMAALWGGLIFGVIFTKYGLIAAVLTHLLANLLTLTLPYLT